MLWKKSRKPLEPSSHQSAPSHYHVKGQINPPRKGREVRKKTIVKPMDQLDGFALRDPVRQKEELPKEERSLGLRPMLHQFGSVSAKFKRAKGPRNLKAASSQANAAAIPVLKYLSESVYDLPLPELFEPARATG
jgi:hypothetical protein